MSTPLSIRFEPSLLERLRRRASGVPGATASGLVQRLVDEGLRQGEHPGVVFRDGPAGRRAALSLGPDVWEVVTAVREVDERGDDAVDAAAELLDLPPDRVRAAIRYYSAFPDEIDQQMADASQRSRAAEQAWRTEQQLSA